MLMNVKYSQKKHRTLLKVNIYSQLAKISCKLTYTFINTLTRKLS